MGGGEAIILASMPEYKDVVKQIRGWVLEAPFCAFPKGFEPGAVTVFAGRLAGKVLPKMKRLSGLPPENLTRDPAVVQSLRDDTLCHDTGTLEGLAGMLDRTALISSGTLKLLPEVQSLLCGHGTKDMGTGYEGSKKWFEEQTQLQDKTFQTYEGWYHQLHCDLPEDRPVYAKDVGDWILARVESEAPQSKL